MWPRKHVVIFEFFIHLFTKSGAVKPSILSRYPEKLTDSQAEQYEEGPDDFSDDINHPFGKVGVVLRDPKLYPRTNGHNNAQQLSNFEQNNANAGFPLQKPNPNAPQRLEYGFEEPMNRGNPMVFNELRQNVGPNQDAVNNVPYYPDNIGNEDFQGLPLVPSPPNNVVFNSGRNIYKNNNPGQEIYNPMQMSHSNTGREIERFIATNSNAQHITRSDFKYQPDNYYVKRSSYAALKDFNNNYGPNTTPVNPKPSSNFITMLRQRLTENKKQEQIDHILSLNNDGDVTFVKQDPNTPVSDGHGKIIGNPVSVNTILKEIRAPANTNMRTINHWKTTHNKNVVPVHPSKGIYVHGVDITGSNTVRAQQLNQQRDYMMQRKREEQFEIRNPPQNINYLRHNNPNQNIDFRISASVNQNFKPQNPNLDQSFRNWNAINTINQHSYPNIQYQNPYLQNQNELMQPRGFNPQNLYLNPIHVQNEKYQGYPQFQQDYRSDQINQMTNMFAPQKLARYQDRPVSEPLAPGSLDESPTNQYPNSPNAEATNLNPDAEQQILFLNPPKAEAANPNPSPQPQNQYPNYPKPETAYSNPNAEQQNQFLNPQNVEAASPNPSLESQNQYPNYPKPETANSNPYAEPQNQYPNHPSAEAENPNPSVEPQNQYQSPQNAEAANQNPNAEPQNQYQNPPKVEATNPNPNHPNVGAVNPNLNTAPQNQYPNPPKSEAANPDLSAKQQNPNHPNAGAVNPNLNTEPQIQNPDPPKPGEQNAKTLQDANAQNPSPKISTEGQTDSISSTPKDYIEYDVIPGWYEQDGTLANITDTPDLENNTHHTAAGNIDTIVPNTPPPENGVPWMVKNAKQAMIDHAMGYFSGFLYTMLLIIGEKIPDDSRALAQGLTTVINNLLKSGQLSEMGEPAQSSLVMGLAEINEYSDEDIQTRAIEGAELVKSKQTTFLQDLIPVFNIIDASYTIEQGDQLLMNLVDIDKYNVSAEGVNGALQIGTNVTEGILRPYWLSPDASKRKLFEMINSALIKAVGIGRRHIGKIIPKDVNIGNKLFKQLERNEGDKKYKKYKDKIMADIEKRIDNARSKLQKWDRKTETDFDNIKKATTKNMDLQREHSRYSDKMSRIRKNLSLNHKKQHKDKTNTDYNLSKVTGKIIYKENFKHQEVKHGTTRFHTKIDAMVKRNKNMHSKNKNYRHNAPKFHNHQRYNEYGNISIPSKWNRKPPLTLQYSYYKESRSDNHPKTFNHHGEGQSTLDNYGPYNPGRTYLQAVHNQDFQKQLHDLRNINISSENENDSRGSISEIITGPRIKVLNGAGSVAQGPGLEKTKPISKRYTTSYSYQSRQFNYYYEGNNIGSQNPSNYRERIRPFLAVKSTTSDLLPVTTQTSAEIVRQRYLLKLNTYTGDHKNLTQDKDVTNLKYNNGVNNVAPLREDHDKIQFEVVIRTNISQHRNDSETSSNIKKNIYQNTARLASQRSSSSPNLDFANLPQNYIDRNLLRRQERLFQKQILQNPGPSVDGYHNQNLYIKDVALANPHIFQHIQNANHHQVNSPIHLSNQHQYIPILQNQSIYLQNRNVISSNQMQGQNYEFRPLEANSYPQKQNVYIPAQKVTPQFQQLRFVPNQVNRVPLYQMPKQQLQLLTNKAPQFQQPLSTNQFQQVFLSRLKPGQNYYINPNPQLFNPAFQIIPNQNSARIGVNPQNKGSVPQKIYIPNQTSQANKALSSNTQNQTILIANNQKPNVRIQTAKKQRTTSPPNDTVVYLDDVAPSPNDPEYIDYDVIPSWNKNVLPPFIVTTSPPIHVPEIDANATDEQIGVKATYEEFGSLSTPDWLLEETYQKMTALEMTTLSYFFYQMFDMIAHKEPEDAMALVAGASKVVSELVTSGNLSGMGQPAQIALQKMFNQMRHWTPEGVKSIATRTMHTLKNMKTELSEENQIFYAYMENSYGIEDGEQLLTVLKDVETFNKGSSDDAEALAGRVAEAILRPYWTVYEPGRKRLFQLINAAIVQSYLSRGTQLNKIKTNESDVISTAITEPNLITNVNNHNITDNTVSGVIDVKENPENMSDIKNYTKGAKSDKNAIINMTDSNNMHKMYFQQLRHRLEKDVRFARKGIVNNESKNKYE